MSDTGIEDEWEFEDELPRRKTRHDNVKTAKKETKSKKEEKIRLPQGYKLEIEEGFSEKSGMSTFYGACPSAECGHRTVNCFNFAGAKATLQHHIQKKH